MDILTDFEALLKRAEESRKQGALDKAVIDYKKVLERDPDNSKAHLGLGTTYRIKAESEPLYSKPALHHLKEALRLNPDDSDTHDQYILAGCRLGMLSAIQEEYAALRGRHPENPLYKTCYDRLNTMAMAILDQAAAQKNAGASQASPFIKLIAFLSWASIASAILTMLAVPLIHHSKFNKLFPPRIWVGLILVQVGLGLIGQFTAYLLKRQ